LVENEPVSDLALLGNVVHLMGIRETSLGTEEVHPDLWSEDGDETVDERNSRNGRDNDKPEPKEDVNLFVDDVERENTKTVVVDDLSGRTIFVERAFRDFGEDFGHWVFSLVRVILCEGQDLAPVGRKFVAKKHVHEEDLADDVDEVEKFAEEEAKGVEVVVLNIGNKVVEDELLPTTFVVLIDDWTVEVHDKHLDSTTFPRLPEVTGNVEEHGLEEEDETHPLVVLVVLHFVRLAYHLSHTWMRYD